MRRPDATKSAIAAPSPGSRWPPYAPRAALSPPAAAADAAPAAGAGGGAHRAHRHACGGRGGGSAGRRAGPRGEPRRASGRRAPRPGVDPPRHPQQRRLHRRRRGGGQLGARPLPPPRDRVGAAGLPRGAALALGAPPRVAAAVPVAAAAAAAAGAPLVRRVTHVLPRADAEGARRRGGARPHRHVRGGRALRRPRGGEGGGERHAGRPPRAAAKGAAVAVAGRRAAKAPLAAVPAADGGREGDVGGEWRAPLVSRLAAIRVPLSGGAVGGGGGGRAPSRHGHARQPTLRKQGGKIVEGRTQRRRDKILG